MDYEIKQLSTNLIFIRWLHSPTSNSSTEKQFLADLKTLLDESEDRLYFLSDLRKGRIINVKTLQKLAQLADHPHWGGSTAFSQSPTTADFVRVFATLAKQASIQDEHQDTPEGALAYLEKIKPGITEGIDWEALL